jgi:hypothetical protein
MRYGCESACVVHELTTVADTSNTFWNDAEEGDAGLTSCAFKS